jgi:hypothetical protein
MRLPLSGVLATDHAHHHPPETSSGEVETFVSGRQNDVVGRQNFKPVWHLLRVQVVRVH